VRIKSKRECRCLERNTLLEGKDLNGLVIKANSWEPLIGTFDSGMFSSRRGYRDNPQMEVHRYKAEKFGG